ncbi:MAG: sugar phosphate isomerase/epimerase [Clostridiales bacterium]|nr:sugar phosphate isomerase/epimerase [Clostridiales bacterium]
MMKLGIIAEPDQKGFDLALKYGLSFIEICKNVGCDTAVLTDELPAIKSLCAKTGVVIGSVGRWGSVKFDEEGKLIDEELKASHTLIDAASELESPVFNTGVNYVEKLSKYENIIRTMDYLHTLMEYAKPKGVQVAVYNCHWSNYIVDPFMWEIFHGHMKDLGIKYDPTHCINDGSGDYLGEMKDWGSRFVHVHIKGTINVNGVHVDDPPAGLDQINWGTFMGLLYKHGYDGNLSIEPHSNTWRGRLEEPGIEFTTNYIKKLLL